MSSFVVLFLTLSTLFGFGILGYVAFDVVIEMQHKVAREKEIVEEPKEVADPVVENDPVEVMPVVDQIDADKADAMISDALAMQSVIYESGAGRGQQGIINIGMLDENFNANDVITLAILKERGLISKKVGRMKVLADGVLTKPLTIRSENYSIQAIKMIELTGGNIIILKD